MSANSLKGVYLYKKDGSKPSLLFGPTRAGRGVRLPLKLPNNHLGVKHNKKAQRLYVDKSAGQLYVFQGDERFSESERIEIQDEVNLLLESLSSHAIQRRLKGFKKNDEPFTGYVYKRDWYIELNQFGAYVTFNGPDDFIETVEKELELERKIRFIDSQPSVRKTKGVNIQFDHYIRFKKGTFERKDLKTLFSVIFYQIHNTKKISLHEEDQVKVLLNMTHVQDDLNRIKTELKNSKQKESSLKLKLKEVEKRLQLKSKSISKADVKDNEINKLNREIDKKKSDLDEIYKISDESSSTIEKLKKEQEELKKQIEDLGDLSTSEREAEETNWNARKQAKQIIGSGFSHIHFLDHTWKNLIKINEYSDLFKVLTYINSSKNRERIASKKIKQIRGANCWFEVDKQLQIGRHGEKARVYWRDNPTGRNFAVHIGLKRHQQRDFTYLADFNDPRGIDPLLN